MDAQEIMLHVFNCEYDYTDECANCTLTEKEGE
jgi:hypothetical protein